MHHENETAHHIESLCGLRLLSPYHDRRLVGFFNRIPPRVLVHGDRYKGLLRPVAQKYLPQLGLESQRKEYSEETRTHRLAALRQSVEAAWSAARPFRSLSELGVVDSHVANRVSRCAQQGLDQPARMFTMLSAEQWIRTHSAH
jgi:hypothetical protein